MAVEDSGATRFTAFPIAFASLGLGILVLAALGSLNPLAVVLAAASLLAVFARLVLSLRDNAGMLVASRYEALTDALTGLGNRRALTRDLDRVAAGQHEGAVLALFDLDGFKHYNDSYGHPAGDALPATPRSQARRARRRRRLGLPDGRRRVLRASRHRQRIPSRRAPTAPPHSASMATASSSPARSA